MGWNAPSVAYFARADKAYCPAPSSVQYAPAFPRSTMFAKAECVQNACRMRKFRCFHPSCRPSA